MHQTTVHKTIIILFASTFMHQASVHTTFMSLCPQQNNARFMHQAAVHTTTNFADAKTQSLNIDAPNLGCINTKMFVLLSNQKHYIFMHQVLVHTLVMTLHPKQNADTFMHKKHHCIKL